MNNKQRAQLLCFFSCIALSLHTHSVSKKTIILGSAVALSMGGLYKFYRWYTAEYTNAELCDQAQKLYDALHEKHGAITFLYRTGLDTISESQLKALIGHNDIDRLQAVVQDLPQLQDCIAVLKKRIKRDTKVRMSKDEALIKWHDELEHFRKKLAEVALFWNEHAPYFRLHAIIVKLTKRYSDLLTSHIIPQEQKQLDVLQTQITRSIELLERKAKECKKYDELWGQAVQLIAALNHSKTLIAANIQHIKDQKTPAFNQPVTQTSE